MSSFEQLGGRERKAEGPEGQVHEVCGRSHDPLWRPRQRLRRLCLQTRSPEAGCAWNQGDKVETCKTDQISSSQKHRQVQLGLSVVSRRRATSFWVWSMPNMTLTSIRSSHFALVVYTSFEEFTTYNLTHTCLTGQDHVAVRPHRQDWTQEASARQRVDRGAQGGDPAAQPLLRDQGCQARPGPRTCCLNSCLYTLISHNHVLTVKH